MQITLRKAHKLVSRIHASVSGSSVEIRLKDTDEVIQEQISAAQTEFTKNIDEALELVEVKFAIRSRIAEANATGGVSKVLTDLEALKAKRSVLDNMRLPKARSATLLFDEIELKREAPTDVYSTPKATASFGIATEAHHEKVEVELKKLEKSIESMNDQREGLNNTVTITLTESEVQLLQAADLI